MGTAVLEVELRCQGAWGVDAQQAADFAYLQPRRGSWTEPGDE